jgi:hypothetical protein
MDGKSQNHPPEAFGAGAADEKPPDIFLLIDEKKIL